MNTTQVIVTLVGFGIIGWIVWYFWLWKGESVTGSIGINVGKITCFHGKKEVMIFNFMYSSSR